MPTAAAKESALIDAHYTGEDTWPARRGARSGVFESFARLVADSSGGGPGKCRSRNTRNLRCRPRNLPERTPRRHTRELAKPPRIASGKNAWRGS